MIAEWLAPKKRKKGAGFAHSYIWLACESRMYKCMNLAPFDSSAGALLHALLEILEELRSDRRVDVPRLRCAIYCVSTMMEAARLAEFGDQLDELAEVIQDLQRGTAVGAVEVPPTGSSAPWRGTGPA